MQLCHKKIVSFYDATVYFLIQASLEKDVEDLMTQIGEQMMQIGELQNQLEQVS